MNLNELIDYLDQERADYKAAGFHHVIIVLTAEDFDAGAEHGLYASNTPYIALDRIPL